MKIKYVVFAIVLMLLPSMSNAEHKGQSLNPGISPIKEFFEEFKEAFNTNDIELVKRLSGETWGQWSSRMESKVKIVNIEIKNVVVNESLTVDVKITARDGKGRMCSQDGMFKLKKGNEGYSMMSTESRANVEFDRARKVFRSLVSAINDRRLASVSGLLAGDVETDARQELSKRGLSWIADAIDRGVSIPVGGSGVMREDDMLIGRISIPSVRGGTNILHEVYFRNSKIDCAAPSELERICDCRRRARLGKLAEKSNEDEGEKKKGLVGAK